MLYIDHRNSDSAEANKMFFQYRIYIEDFLNVSLTPCLNLMIHQVTQLQYQY